MEMITGKYCFVQFTEEIFGCDIPLPVRNLEDLGFFFDASITELTIDIVNVGGLTIKEQIHTSNYFSSMFDLNAIIAPEDCFRLKLTDSVTGKVYFSNVFMFLPDCEYPLLQYWCSKDEFGLHYEHARMSRIRLPLVLDNPSYVDDEEKYTDSNGRTKILYKETRKKYVLKTDYMPYSMHDKLKIALMHDLVMFDGVEFYEVGTYSLGEDIVDLGCIDGVMGKTEVAENFVERNTNC